MSLIALFGILGILISVVISLGIVYQLFSSKNCNKPNQCFR